MSLSIGTRWSGKGISNGRLRLVVARSATRQYSLNTGSNSVTRSIRRNLNYTLLNSQQHRNLSLFGWGSSSKPTSDHVTAPVTSGSDASAAAGFDATRTVKATHSTSDVPDPSIIQSHPVSPLEPVAVTAVQDAVSLPQSTTPPVDVAAAEDLTQIPERIGYLKEICGLDFGWGPTAMLEFCLEHLHMTAGLSWSASIIALGVTFRLLLFPMAARASDQATKMRALQPVLAPLRTEYNDALTKHDKQRALQVAAEIKAITKEAGASLWSAFAPLLVQIPIQFGGFRLLRAAAMVPVPAFETEKWLWTHDLTVADPIIVPILTSVLTYATIRQGMRSGTSSATTSMANIMQYGLPGLNLVFMMFQPGAVQLFFLVNSFMSLGQGYLIKSANFRRMVGLGELIVPQPPASPTSVIDPGGLNRRMKSMSSEDIKPESSSPANRSVIDKAVDGFKERRNELFKSLQSTKDSIMGDTSEKATKRVAKAKQAQIDKYEAKRRQDLQIEREYRNRSVTDAMAARRTGAGRDQSGLDSDFVEEGSGQVGGMRTSRRLATQKKTGLR